VSIDQLISAVQLGDSGKPKYQAIADELAQFILSGQMAVGEKLPPQRALAHRLGVTTGTVSRGYARLEQEGLATARVGDGTYVRALEKTPTELSTEVLATPIDLAHNVAIPTEEVQALRRTFEELSTDPQALQQVLSYQAETGLRRHREAGAQWLSRFGMTGNWKRVMITHGAQHGLTCILSTLARPGDAVLTESLSYPGLQALARLMRLQLIGVEMDEEGMVPQALEQMAKTLGAKLMFCSPTLHNPTGSTMSIARRQDIAAVARRCGLLVIEDTVHATAKAAPLPALSTFLPDQSFLLSSFSKVMAPGLRMGFLEAAPVWLDKFAAFMRADCWMVSPLLPEIATRWLERGTIEKLIDLQRQLIGARLACAREILAGLDFKADPEYPLLWLPLPEPWRAGQFSAALRQAGVLVRTADHFAVGRSPAPHAIRISLNTPLSIEQLAVGLNRLKALIHSPPSASMDP
jgi:DNA-binding transcriptional MocR family regulator